METFLVQDSRGLWEAGLEQFHKCAELEAQKQRAILTTESPESKLKTNSVLQSPGVSVIDDRRGEDLKDVLIESLMKQEVAHFTTCLSSQ